MFRAPIRLLLVVAAALVVFEPVLAQQPTAEQQQQMAHFANFVRAYEARFGVMPPEMRQTAANAAADAIAGGRYDAFIDGFRQAINVPADFGEAPVSPVSAPTGRSAPTAGGGAGIAGSRVYYLQRSPIGASHASGYVHFCPDGFFHEGNEATLQNPQLATANVNSGSWRIEKGQRGPVVGIYYERGPRAGQRIEYNVADMQAGRWMSTNWRYAVDRQAVCP